MRIHVRVVVVVKMVLVTRFEGQGRKDEEVRGDEPEKGCLITQNKRQYQNVNKTPALFFSGGFVSSSVVDALSPSLCITASTLQAGGSLFKSPRQSLESDTGVNHYSLAH